MRWNRSLSILDTTVWLRNRCRNVWLGRVAFTERLVLVTRTYSIRPLRNLCLICYSAGEIGMADGTMFFFRACFITRTVAVHPVEQGGISWSFCPFRRNGWWSSYLDQRFTFILNTWDELMPAGNTSQKDRSDEWGMVVLTWLRFSSFQVVSFLSTLLYNEQYDYVCS